MSSVDDLITDNAAVLGQLLRQHLAARVPGAALAVVKDGVLRFAGCFGQANLEWRRPVARTTVFRLASLSKPFTALAIMQLEREGLIDLDAPVTEYLDNYPEPGRRIRVRHLLTHTSGIPNFVTRPGFAGITSRLDHSDDELLATFTSLPLDFPPGERYGYSNSGYRVLDMIAARVTGVSFGEVLASRVFRPAGMRRSCLLTDGAVVPRRAQGYRRGPGGFRNASYLSLTVAGGAGGIGSTLQDLVAFDRALRSGAFADADLHARLFEPVTLADGRHEGYGLGWALSTYRGKQVVHHGGGINGFSTLYVRVRDADLTIIMLTNLEGYPCADLARRLIDAACGLAPPPSPPAAPPPAGHRHRTGRYRDPVWTIDVAADDAGLVVTQAERTHYMIAVDASTYVDRDDPDISIFFPDASACTLTYPLFWITGYRCP